MESVSTHDARPLLLGILLTFLVVLSAPLVAADQEATWVRTSPGVWMLEDSQGILHEPQPVPGLFLNPISGQNVDVSVLGSSSSTWLINDLTINSDPNEQGSQTTPPLPSSNIEGISISLPTIPYASAIIAVIFLSFALVSVGDEPTRAKLSYSLGRFSELRVSEGTGTLAGTYQRGRLEGFLTAHPGCHLSGIIRALEMGNHQAIHHLRVLERDGKVWCRRDGRLLRYYTSSVDPAAELANLPRPVDANQLSDVALMVIRSIAEQQDGEASPTQRDLATKLQTSQQLVGHHLKRLESQGLITRSRIGLRTNRKLTEEGMRLWATLAK